MVSDDLALLRVYPKRGAKGMVNISDAEYMRLIKEVMTESNDRKLHQVVITNMMEEISTDGSLTSIRWKTRYNIPLFKLIEVSLFDGDIGACGQCSDSVVLSW